jgi:hypothetical protein
MRRYRTVRFGAVLTFVTALGMTLLSSPSAAETSAASRPDSRDPRITCGLARVCVWTQPYFEGAGTQNPPIASGNCKGLPVSFRSIWNNTSVPQVVWTGFWCTGTPKLVRPGETIGDLVVLYRGLGGE